MAHFSTKNPKELMMTKYIFVTGGVLSSLGQGITAASVGALLKHSGINVGMLKIDPYILLEPL